MNLARTTATARRVLAQLRHDPRTIALLLVVPCLLLTLLRFMYDGQPQAFDRVGAALLGIFPLLVMFLVTSVAMLRERTTGTLERLLTMPLGKLDLLLGYALAFGVVALVQAALASALTLGLLGLDVAGPTWLLFAVALGDGLLGMALGLLVSAFAATEFQAVQFLLGRDPAPAAALRAVRAARQHGLRPARALRRAAALLRGGRHDQDHHHRRDGRPAVAGPRGDRGLGPARPRPRGRHPAPPDGVNRRPVL